MTYGSFLLIFLLPPTLLLVAGLRRRIPRRALLLPTVISVVAVLYTTPWDNYLVANRIWEYDPNRISGVLLGWVPLEEYLFFVLQPLLTGWWTLWILRGGAPGRRSASSGGRRELGVSEAAPTSDRPADGSLRSTNSAPRRLIRAGALLPVGLFWLGAVMALWIGTPELRYLALILVWALAPMALQLGYGAPALWQLREAALWSITPATLYLAAADGLAIAAGVWTIHPATSIGWQLFGVLPVEEFVFFLLTNTLIAFSLLLVAPRVMRSARLGSSTDGG